MKERVYTLIFAIVIAVAAYITISTAAKHYAIDEYKLRQFHYEYAVRP